MADIDIGVDEFYEVMSRSEKEEMLELLWDGISTTDKTSFMSKNSLIDEDDFECDCEEIIDSLFLPKSSTLLDEILQESLIKIFKIRAKLSIEQVDSLINFSNSL